MLEDQIFYIMSIFSPEHIYHSVYSKKDIIGSANHEPHAMPTSGANGTESVRGQVFPPAVLTAKG